VQWYYDPIKDFDWEEEDLAQFQPNELVASNHYDENHGKRA